MRNRPFKGIDIETNFKYISDSTEFKFTNNDINQIRLQLKVLFEKMTIIYKQFLQNNKKSLAKSTKQINSNESTNVKKGNTICVDSKEVGNIKYKIDIVNTDIVENEVMMDIQRPNHDCTFKNNDYDDTTTVTKNITSDTTTTTIITTNAADIIQRKNDDMNNNKEKYDNNRAHIIEKVAQGVENKLAIIDDNSTKNKHDDEVINHRNDKSKNHGSNDGDTDNDNNNKESNNDNVNNSDNDFTDSAEANNDLNDNGNGDIDGVINLLDHNMIDTQRNIILVIKDKTKMMINEKNISNVNIKSIVTMNVDKMDSSDVKETENNFDQIIQLQIQITSLLNVTTKVVIPTQEVTSILEVTQLQEFKRLQDLHNDLVKI